MRAKESNCILDIGLHIVYLISLIVKCSSLVTFFFLDGFILSRCV